jgi:sn-glycerol 3-phosphate transport system substrate-binding protein
MMFNSSGAASAVRTSAAFSWQALPYPTSGPKDTAGPIIGGASLWASGAGHTSAEQVASWQLISFLDSPASQAAFSTASGYVPVNTKTATEAGYRATLAARPELSTALTQLTGTPPVPPPPDA